MKFACLVYIDEARISKLTPEEGKRLTDETIESDWQMRREGRLILSQPLLEPSAAVTMRVDGDTVSATDGPFAETKEHLGGFYIIEAADMADARRIVETDPIMMHRDPPHAGTDPQHHRRRPSGSAAGLAAPRWPSACGRCRASGRICSRQPHSERPCGSPSSRARGSNWPVRR